MKKAKTVYLDNAATTRMDDGVFAIVQKYSLEDYGNASSKHALGREAKHALEKSRRTIAHAIGAKDYEIIFTSGGTEANNLLLKGLFFHHFPHKDHIITTTIEHDCVLNACRWLEDRGARVTYLPVNEEGFVDPKEVEKVITEQTLVVSIIHGNNEVGTIQDLEAIGSICRKHGVYFHTDACQSFTKTYLNVKKQHLDAVTLNAHKIHGPKGVGALFIRESISFEPLLHGGGHERGLRSGTENISGIAGFARAVEVVTKKDVLRMERYRDYLIEQLTRIKGVTLNGSRKSRLCNNVNISFEDVEGEVVGGYLHDKGICTSTGSACLAHSEGPSHVLTALGKTTHEAQNSLRVTISKYTTQEEIDYFLASLRETLRVLQG